MQHQSDGNYRIIRQLFGCGVKEADFLHKYTELYNSTPNEVPKLYRIARRIQLVTALRNQIAFRHIPTGLAIIDFLRFQIEDLSSLEIYLIFTCIDILTKSSNMSFPTWLTKEGKNQDSFNFKTIEALYKQYQTATGVSANLKKLFLDLPSCLMDKLSHEIRIVRIIDDKEVELNGSKFRDAVFYFFYDVRRNLFTHSGQTRITYRSNDTFDDDFDFTKWHQVYEVDKKIFKMSFIGEIDEATILRLILHVCIALVLQIDITPRLIDAQVKYLLRQETMYGFIDEVHQNKGKIFWWGYFNNKWSNDDLLKNLDNGIAQLSTKAAKRLIPKYLSENPIDGLEFADSRGMYEQGLEEFTKEYVHYVDILNGIIRDFNEIHPVPNEDEGAWERYRNDVNMFVHARTIVNPVSFLLRADEAEATKIIGLLARNPC